MTLGDTLLAEFLTSGISVGELLPYFIFNFFGNCACPCNHVFRFFVRHPWGLPLI